MKKSLIKDAVVATLMVFALYNLPTLLVARVGFFDPLHSGIERVKKEYENVFIDITQGKISNVPLEADTAVYLVNIDTLNRTEIAQLIQTIGQYNPKVIGVDIVFDHKDSLPNIALSNALRSVADKLVLGTYLVTNQHGKLNPNPTRSTKPYQYGYEGFANFVSEEEHGILRLFLPQFVPDDTSKTKLESLATQIVKQYDIKSYEEFVKHRQATGTHSPEVIVYQRQVADYHLLQPAEFYEGNPELDELKDKIVLIGFLGDSTTLEDKYYSPFNPDGQQPDMSGMVIHANIIEMILRRDYVRYTEGWVVSLLSFMLCLLLMVFLIHQFVKYQLWFHTVFKLIQLILGALAFGIGLWLFHAWQLKVDTLKIIVPVALSVDVLYFYNTIAQWLNQNIGYETYFEAESQAPKKTIRQLLTYLFKKYVSIK